MITVVGVGIQKGDITKNGQRAIKNANRVFSRATLWLKAENLAKKYSSVTSYAELDEKIASEIIEANKNGESVVYCALGDGFTDSVVKLLSERAEIEIIAGVSEYRGRRANSTFSLIGAYDIKEDTVFDTTADLMIYGIDDSFVASEIKLKLSEVYGDEYDCVFSTASESENIKLYELDRMKKYKYSSLFIKGETDFMKKAKYGFSDLIAVMTRLTAPDGCPWDIAQTHESIRINMLEEAYEAVDAVNNGDIDNLREELGDVLLQVVFNCDIAKRSGEFTMDEVISELTQKLVSRHTHIFGENKASDAKSALEFWEKAKAKEKHYSTLSEQLDRIPSAFTATVKLQKAVKKAVKSGASITESGLADKIQAMLSGKVTAQNAGKLIMLAVALCSIVGADGEVELLAETEKFITRLKEAEERGTLKNTDGLL